MKRFDTRKALKLELKEEFIFELVKRQLESKLDIFNIIIRPFRNKNELNFLIEYDNYNKKRSGFVLTERSFKKIIKEALLQKYPQSRVDIIAKPTKLKYNIYYKGENTEANIVRVRKN